MNTTREIDDDWGRCFECGCEDRGIELLMAPCPRCVELAALEREIGRLIIGDLLADRATKHIADEESSDMLAQPYISIEIDSLFTRWRALHAAGAEAATGGEEAG